MTLTANERENLVRWRPEARCGHVESYFLKLNAPDGRRALWIRFTLLSPLGRAGETVAEAWAIAFDADGKRHLAAKESFPVAAADLGFHRFGLTIGACSLGTGRTAGALRTGAHRLTWDLRFTTRSEVLRPLPWRWMYSAPLPRAKLVSPWPDETFEGSFTVDGEPVPVSGWRGMQGHNWGREHLAHLVWVHCNAFDDDPPDTFFEGLSTRLALGPVTTPRLSLLCLRHRGETLCFQAPRHLLGTSVTLEYYRWTFTATSDAWALRGEVSAAREDLVGLHYTNPDLSTIYCLNSKLAAAHLALTDRRTGARVSLRSARSAALEIATRDPDHGVTMHL